MCVDCMFTGSLATSPDAPPCRAPEKAHGLRLMVEMSQFTLFQSTYIACHLYQEDGCSHMCLQQSFIYLPACMSGIAAWTAKGRGGTVSQLGSETRPPVSAELGFQAHQKRWGMGLWRPSFASPWLFRYLAMSDIMAMSFDCSPHRLVSVQTSKRSAVECSTCALLSDVSVMQVPYQNNAQH